MSEKTTTENIPYFAAPTEENWSFQTGPLQFMRAAHKRHGGVCRISFSDREFVLLTGTEANEFVWSSSDLWCYRDSRGAFLSELGEPHVTSSDGEKHRAKRKLINKSFSVSSNIRYLPKIASIVRDHLKAAAEAGEKVALRQWLPRVITRFNLETVSQAAVSDEEFEILVRWQLHFISGVALSPQKQEAHYSLPSYLEDKKAAFDIMGRIVDERLADDNPPDDNFQQVIEAREKAGTPGTRDDLVNELYYILVAGIQNTTHFTITMLREIYSPAGWLDWLREELEDWDGYDAMAVAGMERLKAFTFEIQRNRPQVLTLPLLPNRDFEFGGYTIPEGTLCVYCPPFMHFDEQYFENPDVFDPKRFMDGAKFSPKHNGFFGGGAHVCVGRNVTLLQGPLMVALILKSFDLQDVPPSDTFLIEQSGGEAQTPCEVRIVPRATEPASV
ncbi:cytochrome P450 [Pelagicoccus albus]|uniref:Cytochrome P450 n=1 Tax=Pelagicoccus albus TaxID=415222 RepID=A0A7X1B9P9_9BACT|nr:cytochrome P450 [Pelagicoccus albus]MBC2607914.1 cytochrome P450 [Pelagicoccus albus]